MKIENVISSGSPPPSTGFFGANLKTSPQNPIFGDMHFHTKNSDGAKTTEATTAEIKRLDPERQRIWAATDHDTYNREFVEILQNAEYTVVPGVEISAHDRELGSFHITCYTHGVNAEIDAILTRIRTGKSDRVHEQILHLHSKGFAIDKPSFLEWLKNNGYLQDNATNAHLAMFLFDQERRDHTINNLKHLGINDVDNANQFLYQCLKSSGGHFDEIGRLEKPIPPYEVAARELTTLSQASQSDIVLAIAHPPFSFGKYIRNMNNNQSLTKETRWEFFKNSIFPKLQKLGIQNLEVNALANDRIVRDTIAMADQSDGIITFGSDSHGRTDENGNNIADPRHGVLGQCAQDLLRYPDVLKKTYERIRALGMN